MRISPFLELVQFDTCLVERLFFPTETVVKTSVGRSAAFVGQGVRGLNFFGGGKGQHMPSSKRGSPVRSKRGSRARSKRSRTRSKRARQYRSSSLFLTNEGLFNVNKDIYTFKNEEKAKKFFEEIINGDGLATWDKTRDWPSGTLFWNGQRIQLRSLSDSIEDAKRTDILDLTNTFGRVEINSKDCPDILEIKCWGYQFWEVVSAFRLKALKSVTVYHPENKSPVSVNFNKSPDSSVKTIGTETYVESVYTPNDGGKVTTLEKEVVLQKINTVMTRFQKNIERLSSRKHVSSKETEKINEVLKDWETSMTKMESMW